MRKLIIKVHLKHYLILTVVYLVTALTSLLLFWLLTPQRYFEIYPSIDIFYWACGMLLTYFLNRYRNSEKPDKLLNAYMLCRFAQFLLTIVFLVVGIRVFDMPRIPFVVSLLSNYVVYTGLELYIYHWHNKRMVGNIKKYRDKQRARQARKKLR